MASVPRAGALALLFSALAGPLGAQGDQGQSLSRALDLEDAGKCREAIPFYRTALGGSSEPAGALFGLERCIAEVGHPDTLLSILDSVMLRRPRDPAVRTIQLRTLVTAHRLDAARLAFAHWVNATPQDATPYREYSRLLLDNGLTRAADTVLIQATMRLGSARQVAAELAELKGALGMWEASATHWRQALTYAPYLESSAVFVLGAASGPGRDSIRTVLSAAPVDLSSRRILSGLEMRWRSPRDAWEVLEALHPTDSVIEAWLEFGAQAEERESWLVAKDAYAKALAHRRGASLVVRTASAALQGGEPAIALAYADSLAAWRDTSQRTTMALIRLRALGQLGRAAEAEVMLSGMQGGLDPVTRGDAVRAVAWAWVRVGDVTRARTTLERGGEASDERAAAWMALYEGDLATARSGLRRLDEVSRDAVLALSVIARTRVERAPGVGRAFLALARSDTASAAQAFEASAVEVVDAAPLMLGIAARLFLSTPDSQRSVSLWRDLLVKYPDAPEAAEADLEWARALRRQGDAAGAITRLEHLILTWPRSALAPQARRELELARGTVPPPDGHLMGDGRWE
jgi:tetratricopeptide (TPR) repeat protein